MALNNFLAKQKTLILILHGFILISSSTLFGCRENGPVCIAAPECRGDTAVRFAVIGDWGMWGQEDQCVSPLQNAEAILLCDLL